MIRVVLFTVVLVGSGLVQTQSAWAVYQCGGVQDTCKCGKNNPYPCCDNGSNCTWWAWHMACCNWGQGLPGWGNANTWGSYASQNGNFDVLSYPVVGAIATSTKGYYGHVAYVTGVGNGTITVSEMNCCGTCAWGTGTKTYQASYFNSGFVVPKGGGPTGPYCGNGKCDGGENCANCGKDCGSCCGNGACDHGENCSSCPGDCGSCCGNGACDWGESCSTCSKDCICLPVGSLDNASCLMVRGWAWDTDSSAPVQVRVRVDGVDHGTVVADGPHSGHNGNGFVWQVPEEFRDGALHQVQLEAMDTQSGGFTTLGPKSFMCENSVTSLGIWEITRTDASGIDIAAPASDAAVASWTHAHAGGFPLAVSGQIQSCTKPTVQPFDGVRGRVEFNHPGTHFASELWVDNTSILASTPGSVVVQDIVVGVTGSTLCLTTKALDDSPLGSAEFASLSDWATRTGRWWTRYSANAAGLIVGYPESDTVRIQPRDSADDSAQVGAGWVMASLPLSQPVHGVSTHLTASVDTLTKLKAESWIGDEVLELTVGANMSQTQDPDGATEIGFRVRVADDALPPDFAVKFGKIRVHQFGKRQDGPWWIEKHASYGFDAKIPTAVSPFEAGRCIVLEHAPADWWSTGAVSATVTFPGPSFERVRAIFSGDIQEDGFRFDVYADEEPVLSQSLFGKVEDVIDISAKGNSVTVAFGMPEARETAAAAHVELARLEVLREGWWSTPSPQCVGMRDERLPGGGIRLENSRAWGILGNIAVGVNLVHREFDDIQYGVRFSYKQDLSNEAYRIVVLLDGEPAQIIDEFGLFDGDFEIDGVSFHDLGFAMVAKGQGGVYPHRWLADIESIEVLGANGEWYSVGDKSVATDVVNQNGQGGESRVTEIGLPGDAAVEPEPRSHPRSGGCAASSSSGDFRWPMAVTLAFWMTRRRLEKLLKMCAK